MTDLGHGRGWCRDDAAQSIFRIDKALGHPLDINSAGRTEAEQNHLIYEYYTVGGPKNRPPYLYPPARPASSSPHVKNGGIAIDTDEQAWMLAHGPEYGFLHDVPSDKPHFVYHPERDLHKTGAPISMPATGGSGRRVAGILDMLRAKYGYVGNDVWGPVGIKAFQRFLKAQWGYTGAIDGVMDRGGNSWKAAQRWLKSKYGYTGAIDGIPGDGTSAAWNRADAANDAAF